MLEVASDAFLLAGLKERLVDTIAVLVGDGQGKVFGLEADSQAVDAEDDAREEEHEQEEKPVPLHGDPVLDEQSSDVAEGWAVEDLSSRP